MLDRDLTQLDALLDAANEAWFQLPSVRQRARILEQRRAWIFHELQLEGVALEGDDIERALCGRPGTSWYDENRLNLVRRCAELLATVREQGQSEAPLTHQALSFWHLAISAEAAPEGLRKKEGASEHYRHDVLPPAQVEEAFAELLAETARRRRRDHPVRVAAYFVYEMMRIWPWQQWSALLGRLGASVLLLSEGYPPLVIPARERATFYQAMYFDATRMDALVLSSIREQLEDNLRYAQRAEAGV